MGEKYSFSKESSLAKLPTYDCPRIKEEVDQRCHNPNAVLKKSFFKKRPKLTNQRCLEKEKGRGLGRGRVNKLGANLYVIMQCCGYPMTARPFNWAPLCGDKNKEISIQIGAWKRGKLLDLGLKMESFQTPQEQVEKGTGQLIGSSSLWQYLLR